MSTSRSQENCAQCGDPAADCDGRGENFADFEFYVRPTIDLSAHFLSRGSQVKVISPEWLAEEIHNMHLEAAQMYKPED